MEVTMRRMRRLHEVAGAPLPGRQALTKRRLTPHAELLQYLSHRTGSGPSPLGPLGVGPEPLGLI